MTRLPRSAAWIVAAMAVASGGRVSAQDVERVERPGAGTTVAAAVGMYAGGYRPLVLEIQRAPPGRLLFNARALIGFQVDPCDVSRPNHTCGRQHLTALVGGAQWYARSPHGLEVYGGPQAMVERVVTEKRVEWQAPVDERIVTDRGVWWSWGIGGQVGMRIPVGPRLGAYTEVNLIGMEVPRGWLSVGAYYRL